MGDNHLNKRRIPWNKKLKSPNLASIGIIMCSLCTSAYASPWSITPSITLQQIYSDNINLNPRGQEEDCFLTQLVPSLSIEPSESEDGDGGSDEGGDSADRDDSSRQATRAERRGQNDIGGAGVRRQRGGRVDFDIDFRVQMPLFGCRQANNQLQLQYTSNSLFEVVKDSFFIESQSSIRQQNAATNGRIADNSLANTGNLTEVTSFSVSPYWLPHFGGYAEGEVRFRFNITDFDNDNNSGAALASNSTTHSEQIDLRSGSRFTLFTWELHFFNQEQNRDDAFNNARFQNYNGEIRYHFDRTFNIFAAAGNFNNSFLQNTGSNQNGAFYQIGAQWRPNRYFDIEGAVGRNSFIGFGFNPTNRTNLEARMTKRDVGTNAGGNAFQLTFRHRARRSSWTARYFEETTTVQQRLAQPVDSVTQSLIDGIGTNPPPTTDDGTLGNNPGPLQTNILLPDLTDELFTRKRGEISFGASTPKNQFGLTIYNERREFEQSLIEQDVYGFIGTWEWRIRRNVFSELRVNWQTNDSTGTNAFSNDRVNASFLLGRIISRHISVNVQYNFLDQSSDREINEFRENRITGSLIYQF